MFQDKQKGQNYCLHFLVHFEFLKMFFNIQYLLMLLVNVTCSVKNQFLQGKPDLAMQIQIMKKKSEFSGKNQILREIYRTHQILRGDSI